MENTGYIALSRQDALRRELDIIANNIANANTAGYNGEKALFRDYLERVDSNEKLSTGRKMAFVQGIGTYRDTRPGPMRPTGNSLDLAINGEGYLTVDTPLGPRYTRNGRFQINNEGQLVTSMGYKVLDNAGNPIQLPEGAIDLNIAPNGVAEAKLPGQGGQAIFQQVGQIQVVTFENQQEMSHVESGLYTAAGEEIIPEETTLAQGMVEESNVQPLNEMTRMIELQRTYGRGHKMMEQEHERLRKAIQTLTKTSA